MKAERVIAALFALGLMLGLSRPADAAEHMVWKAFTDVCLTPMRLPSVTPFDEAERASRRLTGDGAFYIDRFKIPEFTTESFRYNLDAHVTLQINEGAPKLCEIEYHGPSVAEDFDLLARAIDQLAQSAGFAPTDHAPAPAGSRAIVNGQIFELADRRAETVAAIGSDPDGPEVLVHVTLVDWGYQKLYLVVQRPDYDG